LLTDFKNISTNGLNKNDIQKNPVGQLLHLWYSVFLFLQVLFYFYGNKKLFLGNYLLNYLHHWHHGSNSRLDIILINLFFFLLD
jgi:hypothetical protein